MLMKRAAILAPLCALLLGATGGGDRVAPPRGFTEVFVVGVIPGDDGNTVILTDAPRERFVPMGIGGSEALSIHFRLEKRSFPRPLTHDLLDSVMRGLGGKLVKVQIDDLHDDTFLGAVYVESRGRVLRFDSRPSDAIALAVGNDVPIFIKRSVLEAASFRPDDKLPDAAQSEERAPPAPGAERTYTL